MSSTTRVVLLLETEKGIETIRVYDAAHDHKRDTPIYAQREQGAGNGLS